MLGKPDVSVFIDNQVVRDSIGGRYCPLLPVRRATRCESTNSIAVWLGEPDMAGRIYGDEERAGEPAWLQVVLDEGEVRGGVFPDIGGEGTLAYWLGVTTRLCNPDMAALVESYPPGGRLGRGFNDAGGKGDGALADKGPSQCYGQENGNCGYANDDSMRRSYCFHNEIPFHLTYYFPGTTT